MQLSKTNRGLLQGLELHLLFPVQGVACLWPVLSCIYRIVPYGSQAVARYATSSLQVYQVPPRPQRRLRGHYFVNSTQQ